MQYALVGGVKSEPQKGLSGICSGCGKKVIAKCGNLKVHHWAHTSVDKCDSWWENETEWHRDWKSHFRSETREVTFYDSVLNEHHRADVHTNGITIELQNSPITVEELKSRNEFYDKIVWVVNGKKFKGFSVFENIPNPESKELVDYNLRSSPRLFFSRKCEAGNSMVEILSIQSKELKHIQLSHLHYSFVWKHPHNAWYSSKAPVFIDLGGDHLFWLKRRVQEVNDYLYLKKVSKAEFIRKYS